MAAQPRLVRGSAQDQTMGGVAERMMTKAQVVADLAEKAGDPEEDCRRGRRRIRCSGHEGSEEQRAVCSSPAGQGREGESQGSDGPESPDWRGRQDPGQNDGEGPPGDSVQRSSGAAQEALVALRRAFLEE